MSQKSTFYYLSWHYMLLVFVHSPLVYYTLVDDDDKYEGQLVIDRCASLLRLKTKRERG